MSVLLRSNGEDLIDIIEIESYWMTVIIMVTVTLVPPVITPGAKAGRFFVFRKQTVVCGDL